MPATGGDEIAKALNRIVRVLAVMLVERDREANQTERIRVLRLCGFGPQETAQILGTTANTVNVALSGMKGKKRKEGARAARAK